jgi:hypothetical protein
MGLMTDWATKHIPLEDALVVAYMKKINRPVTAPGCASLDRHPLSPGCT